MGVLSHNYTHSELIRYCFNERSDPIMLDLAERLEASEDELTDYDEIVQKVADLEEDIEPLEGKAADHDTALKSVQSITRKHITGLKYDLHGGLLDLLDPLLEKFEELIQENNNLYVLLDQKQQ